MTEVFTEITEAHFGENQFEKAYRTAKLALELDPYFDNGVLHKYVASYRIHYAALFKNSLGEIDWYQVLGVDYASPMESIWRRYHRMNPYIHPENHPSAAAKGAYELSAKAFKILGNPESRKAFHVRWNLPPPPEEQHLISVPTTSAPIKTEERRAISRTPRKDEGPATPALKTRARTKFKKESHHHQAFGSSTFG